MNQSLQNIIDRYLHPDQIIFGHLFNPNTKIPHSYEMAKSTPQQNYNDQLIIYKKIMSPVKIQSMLNMMQGKHPPLFKPSIPHSTHLHKHQHDDGTESFDEEDDYEDYEEEMYMMEKDYEDYLDDEYDEEENPIMALGQSMGALPRGKNYARQFDIPYEMPNTHKNPNSHLFMSQYAPQLSQKGLGEILAANKKKNQTNINSTKTNLAPTKKHETKNQPKEQNNSEQDWETDSQGQEEDHQKAPEHV